MHIAPNNKRYIGITCKDKVEQRWGKDGRGYKNQAYFYSAICKYGWGNIEHIIVCKGLSATEAKWLEKELIKCFSTNNKKYGYNQTEGGDGLGGYEFSTEHRMKISESMIGAKNHRYGTHYTDEEKEKMREKALEQWSKEGAREKQSELMKSKMQEFYKTDKGIELKKKQQINNKKNFLHKRKGVICLDTKHFFLSLSEASRYYGIDKSGICRSCKNKNRTAQPVKDIRTHWRYLNYSYNKIFRIKK